MISPFAPKTPPFRRAFLPKITEKKNVRERELKTCASKKRKRGDFCGGIRFVSPHIFFRSSPSAKKKRAETVGRWGGQRQSRGRGQHFIQPNARRSLQRWGGVAIDLPLHRAREPPPRSTPGVCAAKRTPLCEKGGKGLNRRDWTKSRPMSTLELGGRELLGG